MSREEEIMKKILDRIGDWHEEALLNLLAIVEVTSSDWFIDTAHEARMINERLK